MKGKERNEKEMNFYFHLMQPTILALPLRVEYSLGLLSEYHGNCVVDAFLQQEDGIRSWSVTGVQTWALPIQSGSSHVTVVFTTVSSTIAEPPC